MSDIEVSYKAALQKRRQLEKEIEASDAISDEKANMLHTLSKLWIFVGHLHDAAERAAKRRASDTSTEGPK